MSKIESTIESFLKANLAEFDLPIILEVASDLAHGQLTSDVLIRYAQKIKKSPEEISQGLISKLLVFNDDFYLTIVSGHLNVTINRYFPGQLDFLDVIPECQIFFPLAGTGRIDSYFIRILSLAALQLNLSKGKAKISVFADNYTEQYSQVNLRLLESKPCSAKCQMNEELITLVKKLDAKIMHLTLWLSPEQLSKSEISKIYRETSTTKKNLQIQIPHASWLKDLDLDIVSKYRELERTVDQFKLTLLLSGSEPSTDLYYDEAVLPQRNNLGWYLQMTASRLEALGIKDKSWDRMIEISSIPVPLLNLFWSLILLSGYRKKAVMKGLVPDYLDQVYLLLDSLNLFFNSPQLRQKILKNECNDLELQVLSVGLFTVKDLLQLLTLKGE